MPACNEHYNFMLGHFQAPHIQRCGSHEIVYKDYFQINHSRSFILQKWGKGKLKIIFLELNEISSIHAYFHVLFYVLCFAREFES